MAAAELVLQEADSTAVPPRPATVGHMQMAAGTQCSLEPYEHFAAGSLIGSGRFSQVYMARFPSSGLVAALKVPLHLWEMPDIAALPGAAVLVRAMVDAEESVLRTLAHLAATAQPRPPPYFVEFYGTGMIAGRKCWVMEYAAAGSLEQWWRNCPDTSEQLVRTIIKQVATAAAYLHSIGIIHRDLKASNILWDGRKKRVRIADFGTAHHMALHNREPTECYGTPRWMAPEMDGSGPYTANVDVWSLGCLVLELLSGEWPFPMLDMETSLDANLARALVEACYTQLSDDARSFVLRCLHPADLRPSMSAMVHHAWLQGVRLHQPQERADLQL